MRRALQELWIAKYPCLGLFQSKLICSPCSHAGNAAYVILNKVDNIRKHMTNCKRHETNVKKFGIQPFLGTVRMSRNIIQDVVRMEEQAFEAKGRQLLLMCWLLMRKRPISEYVLDCSIV